MVNINLQRSSTTVITGLGYVKTLDGILKIVEMILSFLTFVLSVIRIGGGMGFVIFVSFTSICCVLVIFLGHIIGFYGKLDGPWLMIELIWYVLWALFFFISAIITAVYASYGFSGVFGTASFFAFMTLVAFIIDLFFQFREWKESAANTTARSEPTTVVTTTTMTAAKPTTSI